VNRVVFVNYQGDPLQGKWKRAAARQDRRKVERLGFGISGQALLSFLLPKKPLGGLQTPARGMGSFRQTNVPAAWSDGKASVASRCQFSLFTLSSKDPMPKPKG
jgi:hypothetical protein